MNFVSVHTAGSPAEAMVIRSLLEGNGIRSPGSDLVNPLELPTTGNAMRLLEVYVPESQAEAARCIIHEYLTSNTSADSGE